MILFFWYWYNTDTLVLKFPDTDIILIRYFWNFLILIQFVWYIMIFLIQYQKDQLQRNWYSHLFIDKKRTITKDTELSNDRHTKKTVSSQSNHHKVSHSQDTWTWQSVLVVYVVFSTVSLTGDDVTDLYHPGGQPNP